MESRLLHLLDGKGVLVEEALNERYYSERKKPSWFRSSNYHLPTIKRIPHEGELKILALSDYETQEIEELLQLLKSLREMPDLIVYAGDGLKRLAPPRLQQAPKFSHRLCSELEEAWIECGVKSLSFSCGFILRLPAGAKEDNAKKRIFEVLELVELIDKRSMEKELNERDVVEILMKFPRFQFVKVQLSRRGPSVTKIVDSSSGALIMELLLKEPSKGFILLPSPYLKLYRLVKEHGPSSIAISKLCEDGNYVYFHVLIDEPKLNVLEKLAGHAKYGLLAVAGNEELERFRIHGRNVYELHNTWINIGRLLILGLEGSTDEMTGCYDEGSVRLRLEAAREVSEDGGLKMLIVSHQPPRGVLDRAMRFGEKAVGSLALRDFLEESDNVALVICGHVHKCGGMVEKIGNALVVNVSSHDDPFSRANVAWIVIDQNGEVKEIRWLKIPSLVETILTKWINEEELHVLLERAGLSKREARLFIKSYKKHGKRLLDDLTELAEIKFRYSFAWSNVLKLYDYGVKSIDSITETVYDRVLRESSMVDRVHLKRGYVNMLKERERGIIYLIHPIQIPDDDKVVITDVEYCGSIGVLYGFLDMKTGELKQFWFDEKQRAQEYLRTKLDRVFIHWGGSDKKILQGELNCSVSTVNLLYFVQTNLVAPVPSTSLRDVHDVLCGTLISDEFWRRSFYEVNGLYKLMLCYKILNEPSNSKAREELASINRADILALQQVVERIRELNKGIVINRDNWLKPIEEVKVPVVSREIFHEIVQSLIRKPLS